MACSNCTPPYPVAAFVFNGTSPCTACDTDECPYGIISSKCVYNDGPPLLCIGAEANERLDITLQKIDTVLCASGVGNPYPTYNTYCLGPMANQQVFVETISQSFCTLQADFVTFTETTYPADLAAINATITALDTPNIISCSAIGFTPTDTLKVAITRLADYACGIEASLDLSSVDWELCATVTPPLPATVQEGFDFLISQICNIAGGGAPYVPPTFDNTGSCLDAPVTATDSLTATILKIRSKVCAAPAYNPGTYTPGCFSISGATTLDQLLQSLITQLSSVMTDIPRTFDPAYFTVAPVNVGNLCLGNQVTLTGPLGGTDRLVAINLADGAPGLLADKLIQGTGIVLDTTTIPGVMIAEIDPTAVADEKVKTSISDPTAGYLEDKITGSVGVVSVNTVTIADVVTINTGVNYTLLIQNILDTINGDDDLKAQFCALVASCPSPCTAPSNITVTYIP